MRPDLKFTASPTKRRTFTMQFINYSSNRSPSILPNMEHPQYIYLCYVNVPNHSHHSLNWKHARGRPLPKHPHVPYILSSQIPTQKLTIEYRSRIVQNNKQSSLISAVWRRSRSGCGDASFSGVINLLFIY